MLRVVFFFAVIPISNNIDDLVKPQRSSCPECEFYDMTLCALEGCNWAEPDVVCKHRCPVLCLEGLRLPLPHVTSAAANSCCEAVEDRCDIEDFLQADRSLS